MSRFAPLPDPPYYAVIFSAQRTDIEDGYAAMADKMVELATARPGCIGVESTRDQDGFGITVSYWTDEASILAWKADAKHLVAQTMGKERWYTHYRLRVAKVERHYEGPEAR
jgi:heme-degrading monooxygenase HmoA